MMAPARKTETGSIAMPHDIADEVARRLDINGRHRYGLSDINQIQHGLQAAWLAEQAAIRLR
jgi:predicted HD phosphohydrolase